MAGGVRPERGPGRIPRQRMGGSGRGVAARAARRARRRARAARPARRRCSSGRSGSGRRAAARGRRGRRQRGGAAAAPPAPARRPPGAPQALLELTPHLAQAEPGELRLGEHDDVESAAALANAAGGSPRGAAASRGCAHGAPDLAAHRQPDPVLVAAIRRHDEREQPAVQTLAAPEDPVELRLRLQALAGSEARRHASRPLEAASDREALAALLSTALQHELAALRPHADQETVGALATAVVGLERPLHADPLARRHRSTATRQDKLQRLANRGALCQTGGGLGSPRVLVPRLSRVLPFTRYGHLTLRPIDAPSPPFPHVLKTLCKRNTGAGRLTPRWVSFVAF